jgi:hypothetical protein
MPPPKLPKITRSFELIYATLITVAQTVLLVI